MSSASEFSSQGFTPASGSSSITQSGFIDMRPPVAPKRIVICCDGTWQSSVSGLKNVPSNVTRLARSISRSGKDKNDKVWQQLVYYDAGIGTGDLSNVEKDRQGGFGIGFVGNVIEAYNFIVLNYNTDDEIFCFGFSRGAYTARAVAGLINDIGVISPSDLQDFPDLYALYQKHSDSFHFRKSRAYREWVTGILSQDQPEKVESGFQEPPRWEKPSHRPVPEASRIVQVVGVYDTVGSLGIPDLPWTRFNMKFLEKWTGMNPGFHNVSLSPYIKHAFHALALDERRKPFAPTLWHLPTENELDLPEKIKKTYETLWTEWTAAHQNPKATEEQRAAAWGALVDGEMVKQLQYAKSSLTQVWFPGMHINIGGGSDDMLTEKKGDLEQISLISFAWMCEQVAPFLQLSSDGGLGDLASSTVEDRWNLVRPVLAEIEKGEKDVGTHWFMSKALTALDYVGIKKASLKTIEESALKGWATGPLVDSFTGTMVTAGAETRCPGRYKGPTTSFGATNEFIHPCIAYRREKDPKYIPEALKDFNRKTAGKKGYVWSNGKVEIPELLIKPEDHFTRRVAMQDSDGSEGRAPDFIGGIDIQVGAKTSEAETIETVKESKRQRGLAV